MDRSDLERTEADLFFGLGRLCFYVGCLLIPMPAVRVALPIPLSDVFFCAAAGIVLLSGVRTQVRVSPGMVAASLFAVVGGFLLALLNYDPGAELNQAARIVFVLGLWPLIALYLIRTSAELVRAPTAFVVGGMLSALAGLAELAGVAVPFAPSAAEVGGQPARQLGLNLHPNGQGGTLAVAIAIAAAFLIHGQGRRFAVVATVVLAAGVLLSGSITGTIMAILGLFCVVARAPRPASRMLKLAVVIAPLAYVVARLQSADVSTPFQRFSAASGETGTSTFGLRVLTIRYAWQQILEHPLRGVGLTTAEGGTYNGVTQAHNMEVIAWFQGGPLVLVAVLVAVVTAFRACTPRTGTPWGEAVFAAAVTAFAFAQTGPSLVDRYVWFPAVLAVVLSRLAVSAPSPTSPTRRVRTGERRAAPITGAA